MNFWRQNVDKLLEFNDKVVLSSKGTISNSEMERMVEKVYTEFDKKRKEYDANDADQQDINELKALEEKLKSKKE